MSSIRKDNNGKEYNSNQKIKAVCKRRTMNSKNKGFYNRKIASKQR